MKRNKFSLSQYKLLTADLGQLVPCSLTEVLPGDSFMGHTAALIRTTPLATPVMHPIQVRLHHWFVPTRLLFPEWEEFITGGNDGEGDGSSYPTITANASTGFLEGSVPDYLGAPVAVNSLEVSALPIRAYNKIYNEFYRDQDLVTAVAEDSEVIQRCAWEKDYFTASRPWPQRGPDVTLPLGTQAPVVGLGKQNQTFPDTGLTAYETDGTASATYANARVFDGSTGGFAEQDPNNTGYPNIRADLSNATAATVMQLRQAVQIQAILELDARSGTRYHEQIYAVYGVTLSNVEAYRPLYLGGGSTRIDVNQVPQTSNDGTNGNVAELGAFGTFSGGAGFTKSFEEPGVILGICSARADITYQQGLDRKMSRTDRYSYFHPLLQGIGDQATLKQEIVCQDPTTDTGATGTPDNERTFNYNERYAEYKYRKNAVTGLFRSNATASLDPWHLSEELTAAEPNYNSTFIQQNTPMDRAVQTPAEPHLILDCDFNVQAARPMHMYSVPGS